MTVRLKRLELQGFKSFARPTTLRFDADITAVVGPNGAGKSNLVDALRWVLGESSLRLLRARATEDLIFAGTTARPRAGFARVTAVFDNESGWLPLDFAEVELTRKVYRDGRGEFRLNGRRVRLYEVRELLARAGLADGQAVFIGQGMVDAVLTLKPEARREMLEGAAGIGLFRKRRDEALQRLEETRRNLARLEDLLAELRPQMERLARRARRMQEAQAVQRQLQETERRAFALEWHLLSRHLDAARQALEAARHRYLEQRRIWLRHQEAVRQGEAQLEATRQQLKARQRALQQEEAAWQALLQQEMALQRTWQTKREQRFVLERRRSERASRRALLETRLAELQGELDQVQQERQEAESRLAQLQAQVQAQEKELHQHRARMRELRREEDRLLRRQSALQGRLQALRQRLKQSEQALEALAPQVQQARSDLQKAQAALSQAQEALAQAQEAFEAARNQVQARLTALQQARKALAAQQQALQRHEAQLARVQARLEALEHSARQLEGYSRAVRRLAQKARQQGVFVGMLSALVEPQPQAARALAAVLNLLGDVVVLRSLPPELARLAEGSQAQVLLLTLEDEGGLDLPPSPKASGVLGRLLDFLQAEAPLKQALEPWLGRVLLAQDRATARDLTAQGPFMAVTVDGEVFLAPNFRALGRPGMEERLRRHQERRQLQRELETLQAEAEALRARLRASEAQEQAAQQALQEAQSRLEAANEARRQAEQAHHRAAMNLEAAQAALQRLQARRESLLREIDAAREEQAALEKEAREVAQALQRLGETREALARRAPGRDLDRLRTERAYWEQQMRFLQERQRKLVARLQGMRREYEDLTRQMQQEDREAERLQQEIAEVEQRLEDLRRRRQAQEARLQELRAGLKPLEEALQRLEAQWREGRVKEQEARQSLREAEARLQEAQLRLQRVQSRRAGLWRRLREAGWHLRDLGLETTSPLTPLPLPEAGDEAAHLAELERLRAEARALRQRLKRLGPVVPEILEEYRQLEERVRFLETQMEDIRRAEADLLDLLRTLEEEMRKRFRRVFQQVQKAFQHVFTRLFGGGRARLVLTDPEHWERSGIDIEVRLPGKRTRRMALLSGGERSLTALALIFALVQVAGTPLCVLDEVDAMLDEANVGRFLSVLQEMQERTQFIIITHNPVTIQAAHILYGITLDDDGTSRVLSLRLEDAEAWVRAEAGEAALSEPA